MVFDVGQFDFGAWGASGYGGKDVDEAKRQGASTYNLWQLADRAEKEGLKVFGSNQATMKAMLTDRIGGARPSTPFDHDFGEHGYWGFGTQDIDHVMGRGGDPGQLEALERWAVDHGVQIGGDVKTRILEEKQKKFMTDLTAETAAAQQARDDKQTQFMADFAAEQKKHQDFMAAEQKAANERMRRVRSSAPQGVGGNAAFRGSRLNTSTVKGGGGTQRFSRVTQPLFMNPLGGVAGQSAKGSGGLNL